MKTNFLSINVKKIIFFPLFLYFLVLLNPTYADITPPDFPSCANPQGTIIANYDTGSHAIVGSVTLKTGIDTVYSVANNIIIQCFCPPNTSGIQTNWWKIPELTAQEIENFKSQGWTFIPEGALWGLQSGSYFAKNESYSCLSSGGGGGGGSGGGESSSSGSSGGSSSGGSGGGEVSGATQSSSSLGEILSLAATGNILTIYSLLGLGIILLSLSYLLAKRKV